LETIISVLMEGGFLECTDTHSRVLKVGHKKSGLKT